MDEMPKWWPPVWVSDNDGSDDYHWYMRGTELYPKVRMWGPNTEHFRKGEKFSLYAAGVNTEYFDNLLEILCVLIEWEKNYEKLASNTHGTRASGGTGE